MVLVMVTGQQVRVVSGIWEKMLIGKINVISMVRVRMVGSIWEGIYAAG